MFDPNLKYLIFIQKINQYENSQRIKKESVTKAEVMRQSHQLPSQRLLLHQLQVINYSK